MHSRPLTCLGAHISDSGGMLVAQLSVHYFTLHSVLTLFKFLASITICND
jgi:hypothetical protein